MRFLTVQSRKELSGFNLDWLITRFRASSLNAVTRRRRVSLSATCGRGSCQTHWQNVRLVVFPFEVLCGLSGTRWWRRTVRCVGNMPTSRAHPTFRGDGQVLRRASPPSLATTSAVVHFIGLFLWVYLLLVIVPL